MATITGYQVLVVLIVAAYTGAEDAEDDPCEGIQNFERHVTKETVLCSQSLKVRDQDTEPSDDLSDEESDELDDEDDEPPPKLPAYEINPIKIPINDPNKLMPHQPVYPIRQRPITTKPQPNRPVYDKKPLSKRLVNDTAEPPRLPEYDRKPPSGTMDDPASPPDLPEYAKNDPELTDPVPELPNPLPAPLPAENEEPIDTDPTNTGIESPSESDDESTEPKFPTVPGAVVYNFYNKGTIQGLCFGCGANGAGGLWGETPSGKSGSGGPSPNKY